MKQYLVSVYHPEYRHIEPAEMDQIGADVNALNDEIRAAGRWIFAGGLHPSSTATTLRLEDGEVLTTDGPFAEGKEHIGGFLGDQGAGPRRGAGVGPEGDPGLPGPDRGPPLPGRSGGLRPARDLGDRACLP